MFSIFPALLSFILRPLDGAFSTLSRYFLNSPSHRIPFPSSLPPALRSDPPLRARPYRASLPGLSLVPGTLISYNQIYVDCV